MNPPHQPTADPADPGTWFTTTLVDVGVYGTAERVAINVMREARYAAAVRRELLSPGIRFGRDVA